jgi:molybdopterin-guanine dinucleotide biosynthesis protein A
LGEYQYRRLEDLFDKVYISTKSQKFDFEAPLILDRYPQSSPLVALISIFESIPDEACFILSVDAPFVDKTVIEKLYEKNGEGDWDAVIAQSPEGTQPLCGIYRRSILPIAKTLLAADNHRLGTLLKTANTLFVSFQQEAPFTNLNHPHEYEAALQVVKD